MKFDNFRKTKIVATLGPSSLDRIDELITAGVNVFRLNFSHGTHEQHAGAIEKIRKFEAELNTPVAILADLQGPKIRVGKVIDGGITLVNGEEFTLTTEACLGEGNRASTVYTPLSDEVKAGDRILLDDGLLEIEVKSVSGKDILTTVIAGGLLTSNKGINLPNVDIKSPALTEKDNIDLLFVLTQDVDFVALSFVRNAADLDLIHGVMDANGRRIPVISKIEKPEALVEIDAIIEKSYGSMVARGDLGVEIPAEEVPLAQKSIINKCNKAGKPVIVATQMLDSMIRNPRPTRAECSDIANAVLDGASAVMLSGETASGDFPIASIEIMGKIALNAEASFKTSNLQRSTVDYSIVSDVETITYSAVNAADGLHAKFIVCITDSGNTARHTARYRPLPPVVAITAKNNPVMKTLCLTWGVQVVPVDLLDNTEECFAALETTINNLDGIEENDLIIVTAGLPIVKETPTNMMKLHRVSCESKGRFL